MKKIALLLVLIPGLSFAGANKIAFLKEKLITTPREQATTKENIAKKLIPAIGLSILINWICFSSGKKILLVAIDKLFTLPNLTPTGSEILGKVKALIMTSSFRFIALPGLRSLLIYYIAHRIILKKLEKTAFLQFIEEWESNKKHTPKAFSYAFEELYLAGINNKPLDSRKVNSLKERIRKLTLKQSPTKG